MGFSEKSDQLEGGSLESEEKTWAAEGFQLGPQLKPISTKSMEETESHETEECSATTPTAEETTINTESEETGEYLATTPTAEETRIPVQLTCPPPPKKKKSLLGWDYNAGAYRGREFFIPPDLETLFVEKSN